MHLGTFVSIGAGLPKLLSRNDISSVNPAWAYMEHTVKVATDTENVHKSVATELKKL